MEKIVEDTLNTKVTEDNTIEDNLTKEIPLESHIHPSSKPRYRYKASREARAKTKKATKKDYKQLVTLAMAAVLNKQWRVLITFPYFITFSKGWPRGTVTERTATTNTYKVNTRLLLDWLYEKGYSKYNTTMLVMAAYQVERHMSKMDRMFMTEEEISLIEEMGYIQ